MSNDRIRVASRDWWPSRIVVSVISTFFCFNIQSATACGPFCSSRLRVPIRASAPTLGFGARALRASAAGLGRPAVSGCPLTVMSAM